ncbi:radical SAM protein [Nannocystis sp. SCPEA4]|uniref:radical SAM protein n=1 Tax=Nannocystis sp. SCPEA4 TaxID=2996787 RepID=UPI002270E1B8|nr:radical SAM protein [Nannocystis sp. SCPEA4]MCY1059463.1 radical SAM protein [Nannocystis sp. SCPEA4]
MTGELSSFDEQLAASVRADRLQLILLPTEQCNFRCTYCYEDFAIGRMTPEVVSGVKNLIDRRADGLSHLQLSWFGGEPTLARSIIEDISSHVLRTQERCKGLRYQSDMTTNGYLLDGPAAEHLARLGVRRYQVSLDGPGEYHDRTRLRADGKGTFNRIWSNLLSIRASPADVHVMLRIHMTPENIPVMADFLRIVRDTLLVDPRFTVFLKRVVRLGGANDSAMEVLESDDPRIAALVSLVAEGGTEERLYEPEEVCYAARANSLLVRADGRLGKCTVALSDPANTIGQLLPDGRIRIDNAQLRPWLQGWESRDPELTGCPYVAFTSPQPRLVQITHRRAELQTPT